MQAYLGDSVGAMETAARKGGNSRSSLELARILAAQGVDVQPIISQVTQEITSENRGALYTAGMLVETQRELGLIPDRTFIDQFRENPYRSQGDRDSHNTSLVTAYSGGGFPEDALEFWHQISERYPIYPRARSLARVAEAHARSGLDTSDMIAKAQELAEAIKPSGPFNHVPGTDRARVYARLARVEHLSGNDPQLMIDRSLAHAMTEPTNYRTQAFISIAKAQLSFGKDASDTLVAARDWTSGIVKPDDPPGSWGPSIQIADWEDVFRVQLEGGYLADARQTLEEYNRYPEEEVAIFVAGLRASLSRAQILSTN